jgi:flagellar motor switch protein FliG
MPDARTSDTQKRTARILGLPAQRAGRLTVAHWVPPTRAQIDVLPPPEPYPSTTWEEALRFLQAGSGRPKSQVSPAGTVSSAPPAQAAPAPVSATQEAAPAVQVRNPPASVPENASPSEEIALRAEAAASVIRGFIDGVVPNASAVMAERPTQGETGLSVLEKAGILFVAIGTHAAGEVMKFLSDHEIEQLTSTMVTLHSVSVEMQTRVVDEFLRHLRAGSGVSHGGVEYSRGVLERALGPRKAQEILERVANSASSGFYMLRNVSPEQVAFFIAHEHPQTIALILSQLDALKGAGILTQLPERLQADVAYRIATMENITPAVLKEIEEALEASLRDMLGGNQDVGGPKVMADMLNLAGSSVEKNVLVQMDVQDPEAAEAVRNLMFTFADIQKLTDWEIPVLLRAVEHKDLVCALKAAEEGLKDKLLRSLTAEEREVISNEMEELGPMRLSDVEEVQLRIVQVVRELEEQGQITIVRGNADNTFV